MQTTRQSALPAFPSPVQVLRRIEEKQRGERGKNRSVDLTMDFRGRLTELDSLIRSCRRTGSLSPRREPRMQTTRKVPKHLMYGDIHRMLKDDLNKTKRLMQKYLTQTLR